MYVNEEDILVMTYCIRVLKEKLALNSLPKSTVNMQIEVFITHSNIDELL